MNTYRVPDNMHVMVLTRLEKDALRRLVDQATGKAPAIGFDRGWTTRERMAAGRAIKKVRA